MEHEPPYIAEDGAKDKDSLSPFLLTSHSPRAVLACVRELADGGTWNTNAGQPTDDSEIAMLLARVLAAQGKYAPDEARKADIFWLGPDRIYSHP